MIKIGKLIIGNQSTTKKKTSTKKSNKNTKNKRPEYQKSDAVISAENALNKWEKNKPGEYKSKYSDSIDRILYDILNREDFSYNMNADPMYQQYRESYIQNGKKAMMDTLGQATALTGGYLNSYAATVGNQVYDEYLNQMNDIALELRDRAYDMYVDEGDKLIEDITILRSLDGDDYDRYWDSVQQYYYDGEYLIDKLVSMSDAEFDAFLAEVEDWESDRDYAFEKEKEKTDKQQFNREMQFKEDEAKRDQKNKDRQYNLDVKKSQSSTSTSKSKGSSNTNTKSKNNTSKNSGGSTTKGAPKTYNEFYDRTGISGILTESEFYSSEGVRKRYGTYQKYLEVMYEKYG